MLWDEAFNTAITLRPSDSKEVKTRFDIALTALREVLRDHAD